MPKFRVGDRVASVVDNPEGNHNIHIGSAGVVCYIDDERVAVYWDDYVAGHSCNGKCPSGYGWWMNARNIEFDDGLDDTPFEFDEVEFNKLIFG